MKTCKSCGEEKGKTEFYPHPTARDRLQHICKECSKAVSAKHRLENKEYHQQYQFNINRHNIQHIYRSRYDKMCRRVTGYYRKNHSSLGKELLTLEEFYAWCAETEKEFLEIYNTWKEAEFDRELSPTIDRIDNDLGYVPSNMQWLTLRDNRKKGRKKEWQPSSSLALSPQL